MSSLWPSALMLVRHGQSAGNVALERAEAAGASVIEIGERDVDVPLSQLGQEQAEALGDWFAQQPPADRPEVILCSPYKRAGQTAEAIADALAVGSAGTRPKLLCDERLREREFGVVDRYTRKGVLEKFPLQAELHDRLGKFYYRAPGGESWCDVILRLRSVQDTLSREYAGRRVLIVCHTVVILCFRYLFEELDEKKILRIDRENRVANCGLTIFREDPESRPPKMKLERFNFTVPLSAAGEPVTTESDVSLEKK